MTWRRATGAADWIWIALAVVLGALVVLTARHPTDIDPNPAGQTLLSPQARGTWNVIRWARNGAEVTLDRQEKAEAAPTYQVRGSGGRLVDPARLDALLNAVQQAEILREVPAPDQPKDPLGMAHPRGVLSLESEGLTLRLVVGGDAPSPPGSLYVRLQPSNREERSVVVSSSLRAALDIAPSELWDRRLIPYLPSELASLHLIADGRNTVLEREPRSGIWYRQGPPRVRVSRDITTRLVLAITELAVNEFIEPASARKSLGDSALLTLHVKPRKPNEPVWRLELGGHCPKQPTESLVLVTSPSELAGCLPKAAASALRESIPTEPDRSLFTQHMDETDQLTVKVKDRSWGLLRHGSSFLLRPGSEREVDLDAGNALLTELTSLQGSPLELGAGVEFPVQGSITLRSNVLGDEEAVDETVELAAPLPDGRRRVRRKDDGLVLQLDADRAALLELDPALLAPRQLLDWTPQDVTRLEIQAGNRRQVMAVEPDGVLRSTTIASGTIDPAQAESLRENLATLTVKRWLPASGFACPMGKAKVVFRFSSDTRQRPDSEGEMELSVSTTKKVVGCWQGNPQPFELDADWLDPVRPWLHQTARPESEKP